AITFLNRSDSAIIADDVENNIYMISTGQVFTIARAADGISKPIGIGVSNNNQRIFIGNSDSASISTIGPNGAVEEPQYCNCILSGVYSTNADSVFRLTDFTGGPLLLFDASG